MPDFVQVNSTRSTSLFNKSVRAKLVACVAGGVLLLLGVCVAAIVTLYSNERQYQSLLEQQVDYERQVHILNLNFKVQVQEWKNVLLRGADPERREEYWGRFTAQQAKIQADSTALLNKLTTGSARNDLQQFNQAHAGLQAQYQNGLNVFIDSDFDQSAGDAAVSGVDREPTRLLQSAADKLSNETQAAAEMLRTSTERTALWTEIGVALATLITFSVLWVVIQALFMSPLKALMEIVEGFTQGNFQQRLETDRQDEIGDFIRDLDEMQTEIALIVAAVQKTSEELSKASADINQTASQITRHTGETESSTDQVAAAITEMSQTVQEVASSIQAVAGSAEQADSASQNGLVVMERTVQSIATLSEEVSNVGATMDQLEKDTASIGAVLDVIKGIAEQTNLLALNAAIEAARAGEQGRGFAVVADEVRALARRTQESTTEIQHIIETVQSGAANAAGAMRKGKEQSSSTVEMASETGKSIREISGAMSQIRDMVNHIATAAEEQSYATEEINRNIVNVVTLVQSSHEAARHSNDIATELDATSEKMREQVQKFKV